MTVSQTTMESYISIQGHVGKNQAIVYKKLLENPCASNEDLARMLGWPINCVTPRTNELRKMELVYVGGTKKSATTGKSVQCMVAVEGAVE